MRFQLQYPNFLPHKSIDLEFFFEKGQGYLIVGENGVGKSTLLKKIKEQLSDGILVEQKALDVFYDRTLGQIKKILLSFKQDEDLLELWKTFGLDEKENRYLSTLSGGEQQCLKLISALCLPAEFYLLDEPSQFLDVDKKQKLKSIIELKRSKGRAVIVVEHDYDWLSSGFHATELLEGPVLKKGRVWTT